MQINTRSLTLHHQKLENLISNCDAPPDIIAISETRLEKNFNETKCNFQDTNLYINTLSLGIQTLEGGNVYIKQIENLQPTGRGLSF